MTQKLAWLKAVMRDRELNQTAKNVACALFFHHNQGTGLCCPKQDTIAETVGLKRKPVNAAIGALEESGWIVKLRTRTGAEYGLKIDRAGVSAPAQMSPENDNLAAPDVAVEGHEMSGSQASDVAQNGQPRITVSSTVEDNRLSPPTPSGEGAPTETDASGRTRKKRRADHPDAVGLPIDWLPEDAGLKLATQAGLRDDEIKPAFDRFRAYHHGKGTVSPDWLSMWSLWCQGHAERRTQREARTPDTPKKSRFQI